MAEPDATADHISRLSELMAADEESIFAEMDREVFASSPELAADATMAAETAASNHANMRRWLGAVHAHPDQDVGGDPPPEALEIAASLTRRGIDPSPLFSAYRAGQNVAWRRWMELAAEEITDRGELIAVLERSSALMNNYVDMVLDAVLEEIQRQREAMLGGEPTRRAETIRLILDGAPLTAEVASSRLGYEVERPQTALVIWTEERGVEAGELERAAVELGRAGGAAGRPLSLSAGSSVLWVWLGGSVQIEAIKAAAAGVAEQLRVAIGPTRAGLAGFRGSHRAAIDAQRILAGTSPETGAGERAVSWDDVQAVALAGQDPEAAREFVASVLGVLAEDGASRADLRETVRAYLEEGSSAPAAARRLHLHRNTVLYRLGKAEELLGYPVAERPLALMLALELDRFGS